VPCGGGSDTQVTVKILVMGESLMIHMQVGALWR
jgi:hypothetical protein